MRKLAVLPCLLVLLAQLPASAATQADVDKAGDNAAALKAIASDAKTTADLRFNALLKLPAGQQIEFVDSDLFKSHDACRAHLLVLALINGKLPYTRVPEAAAAMMAVRDANGLFQVQQGYIRQLLKDGKYDVALQESKRLIGVTPLDSDLLTGAVQLIAGTIRADGMNKGHDPSYGVAFETTDAQQAWEDGSLAGILAFHTDGQLYFDFPHVAGQRQTVFE